MPEYHWWNEGLHGVARAGTATVFPQEIALAAIVVQLYVKDLESAFAVPNHSLADFKRVHLPVGKSQNISLRVPLKLMQAVLDSGEWKLDSKRSRGFVGISQPDNRSVELTGSTPLSFEWNIR